MRTHLGLTALLLLLAGAVVSVVDSAGPLPAARAADAAAKKNDAPYVKLPATLTSRPNRYFKLKCDSNCRSLKWIIPDGLESFPFDGDVPRPPEVQLLVGDVGTYKVQVYGALGDQASDIATCVVTIGTAPPGPGPAPNPLTAALQAAYNQDTDADKAASLEFLQEVYAGMASQAATWTDVKTNGDAMTKIRTKVDKSAANADGLAPGQVVNLRKAIATDFVAKFGTTETAPIGLAALQAELNNVAGALVGVK